MASVKEHCDNSYTGCYHNQSCKVSWPLDHLLAVSDRCALLQEKAEINFVQEFNNTN